MFRWIPYTFVRTVIVFISGILLALCAPDLIGTSISLVLILTLLIFYIGLAFGSRQLKRYINPGLLAMPLVFILGYVHLVRQTESRQPDHLLHTPDNIGFYKVVITRFAEEKTRSWKIEARVSQVHTGTWHTKTGKILLYFPMEYFPDAFGYGDVLLIKGSPQLIPPPGNPGEFDYQQFLANKNIYHQHFVRAGDVIRIGNAPPSQLMAYAISTRLWAESTLERFVSGDREKAIAKALVLGVTDGLDNDLLEAYAATGSMHVLAVSGLHVSIIYMILLWLMRPLNKVRGGRWLVAIISLTILWMYAFVTGVSPSVLRAVTMFSFIAIGTPWARRTNIYNTLAVSAFFLLLFDPLMILSVGFQLSYLAVLGIVYLYPRLLALWEPKQWVVTEIWKITCVSIAAQVATFSLGLLYFHQFPNYFLLSNLLVVPLSFVVLIVGLLVLTFSFIPVIAMALGFCLAMIIKAVNYIVFTIERFPFSVVDNIFVSLLQTVLLMSFVIVLVVLFESRKFRYVLYAACITFIFAAEQWLHFSRDINVRKFTVYKIPGHSAIDFIDRGHATFVADSALTTDTRKLGFHVAPNRLISGVTVVATSFHNERLLKGCKLITWKGTSILHITARDFSLPGNVKIDWIIIGNNSVDKIEKLAHNFEFKKIILDSSNSANYSKRFLEEAKLYNFGVHSVLHDGAFALKIENPDT
jgi:competence protein ComEC